MQCLRYHMFHASMSTHCLKEVDIPPPRTRILCQTMQYCCLVNACDTCPALRDLHFNLTVSLYANSGHFPGFVNSISENRQMPAPQELSQQIPAPWQKLGCKNPRVGANFWCKSPGLHGGGVVMDEIDTCITFGVSRFTLE